MLRHCNALTPYIKLSTPLFLIAALDITTVSTLPSNNMKVVVVTDAAPLHCWPNNLNVENPQRVIAIHRALTHDNHQLSSAPSLHPRTHDAIAVVHTPSYVQSLQQACAQVPEGEAHVLADPEIPAEYTYITHHSYDAAVRAVSTCLHAADAVAGSANPAPWFVAVRPPGHHAVADKASGFCLLSNVAIMVRFMQQRAHGGIQRVRFCSFFGHTGNTNIVVQVAIIDFDVHHGNGTQAAFYDDPDVLFIDIHQAGVWPGSGGADERGEGPGQGTTLNVLLPVHAGNEALHSAWEVQVEPLLTSFRPGAIVASAGFDAHADDPLGELQYRDEAYQFLGRALVDAATRLCGMCESVSTWPHPRCL